jgi:hypothetical protein
MENDLSEVIYHMSLISRAIEALQRLINKIFSDTQILNQDEADENTKSPDYVLTSLITYNGSRLNQILNKISIQNNRKKESTIREIFDLNSSGRIYLKDPNPPKSLIKYFISLYSLWFWLIEAFLAITVLSILYLPSTYPFYYLRAISGLLFPLFIPGYILVETIYPQKSSLERFERLILSIGLSIFLVPSIGLFLNYTPWRITLISSLISLVIIVTIMGIIGIYRKFEYWKLTLKITS